jgi:phenylacetate-coenzyme A ligase PaaK-like adenylate-forming protein
VRDLVPVGRREVLPIDVALILYEFPEVSTPSAEYQVVRPAAPAPELHVRCEHAPGIEPGPLAVRIAERFRDRLDVRARLELVPRGGLPRFAYKAARVVDA